MFDILTLNIGIELFGIIICLTVILCKSFIVGSHRREIRTYFMLLVFCEAIELFLSAMCGMLSERSDFRILLVIFCFLRYLFDYILLGLFTKFTALYFQYDKEGFFRFFTYGLLALGASALAVNLFYPIFYCIGRGNEMILCRAFPLLHLPFVIICTENLVLVIRRRKKVSGLVFSSFIMSVLLPVAAIAVQIFFIKLDLVNISFITVLLYMFIVMQNELAYEYIEQKKSLQESKTKLMLSQIKPHFLFNSLTSIAQLCDDNPHLAKTTAITFANYLRGNINALEQSDTVPFSDELMHIKNYLEIESVRFSDLLKIEYGIETEDFKVPPLSVQPLVENAVKHGVGMKENGGTVKISVQKCDDNIILRISDDGVGFDVNAKKDGSHIGIQSSKERFENLCNAKMTVESKIGVGTDVTVVIPKGAL